MPQIPTWPDTLEGAREHYRARQSARDELRENVPDLPTQVYGPFASRWICTADDIARATDEELMSIRNVGKTFLSKVREIVPYCPGYPTAPVTSGDIALAARLRQIANDLFALADEIEMPARRAVAAQDAP